MRIARVVYNKAFFLWLLLLIALSVLPFYSARYTVILLTTILMYVILTVSWTLFSGPTGYISLAPAAFFGVGIYASAVLGTLLPMPVVIVIGGLASFFLAVLVGALTLRLRGIYFVMFTFGLVELLLNFVLWWEVNIYGTTGRVVPSMGNTTVFYLMVLVFAVLMLTAYLLKRSKYGMALQSIGENEDAAGHIGINVTRLKILTFGASAFFMGVAGAIMATRWTYIDPKIAFSPVVSFMPVLMAIFGGTGQLYGPLIGAAIFSYLQEYLVTRFPYHYMLIFGIILVTAILYMPDGLVGLVHGVWKRIRGRKHADT
jgi:branched-chain amino acid transport system permease protein